MMKRILSLFAAVAVCFAMVACTKEPAPTEVVSFEYMTDASAIIPMMAKGDAKFAVLGEPSASAAVSKISGAKILFDLQAEWKDALGAKDSYPQAGLFVKSSFVEENDAFVAAFMEHVKGNDAYVTDNYADLKQVLTANGSNLTAEYTPELVARLNLKTVVAAAAKPAVEEFLGSILAFDKTQIGDKLPDSGFYASVGTGAKADVKADAKAVKVFVPDGAPALAIAKLLAEKPVFDGYTVTYEIVQASQIAQKLQTGEADLAIAPTNVGAKFYNKSGAYKMLSANVHGILYLVGTQDVDSLEDLKGKTVYNTAAGGTTDIVLKYILQKKGIAYEA